MACLLAFLGIGDRIQIMGRVPHELPPQALAAKAREIADSLGYKNPPRDRAFGFGYETRLASQVAQGTTAVAEHLGEQRPSPVHFWYRESSSPLVHWGVGGVKPYDPAPTLPGMIAVRLDSAGRLILFHAIPAARQPEAEERSTDWAALFSPAGLDLRNFEPAKPERVPPVACDVHRAWQGSYPDHPESRVRVEAASLAGRPVYFQAFPPWEMTGSQADQPLVSTIFVRPDSASTPGQGYTLAIAMGLLACWLAWRNIRNGRGDRRGAFRFAACAVLLQLFCRVVAGDLNYALIESHRARVTLGGSLFVGFYGWVAYVALEPLIRRKWLQTLVSWSRLLAGRIA